jgi:hypothetical protein
MLLFGVVVGVLLLLTGLLLMVLIALGVGLLPNGADSSLVGVDARSFMAICAALCLASGMTLVGLGLGHWQQPKHEETADQQ